MSDYERLSALEAQIRKLQRDQLKIGIGVIILAICEFIVAVL